jgi:glyoxylase-like metal-dependent hydrolase (beta-lactamase superfamily II)
LKSDFNPRHGNAVEVAYRVRRVTAPNAGPFTLHGTNSFLIGERKIAVLDPGPADSGHVDALMRSIGDADVAHILVSHSHRDHSPAARMLRERTGAPILAAGPNPAPRRPRPGEDAPLDAGGDVDFVPDVTLGDGSVVEGADYRLEAIATPGHASNHLAFALPDAGLIFSGDHVMGWSTTVVAPPDGSMSHYMSSLDRMLARRERLYLPAHGDEIVDGPARVRALKAHRKMREAAILEGLRRGRGSIAELVERVYQGLDPRLVPAASLSTLAQLEDLVARGVVAADGPPTLTARYWPAEATPGVEGG